MISNNSRGCAVRKETVVSETSFTDEDCKTREAEQHSSSATGTAYYQYGLNGELLWSDDGDTQDKYVYANAQIWAEVRTSDGENATYYHHTDHLGTTETITDATGTVVWDAVYEAYGTLVHENGTVSFKASYTGKQVDEETGLYYFNARWYDSELGRFVTEDPARDGTNWYEYCSNNPLIRIDLTGNIDTSFSGSQGPYDTLKKIKSVETGDKWYNKAIDFAGASLASVYNLAIAGPVNMASNAIGYTNSASESAVNWLDDNVPSQCTASGSVRNDIDAVSFALTAMTPELAVWAETAKTASAMRAIAGTAGKGTTVGYHATTPEAAESILENGFRLGTKPGRLGSGGVYVNDTVKGSMAEFAQHNPGITPSVLRVEYQTGINAIAATPPGNYVMHYPLNVGSISAESLRLPGTFNTNILNGTAVPTGIMP